MRVYYLQSNKLVCFRFKDTSSRQQIIGPETKDLFVHRTENSRIISTCALVLLAKTHRVMPWARMLPARAAGCLTGTDPKAKRAELFEEVAKHCSKLQTTLVYPSPLLLQSPWLTKYFCDQLQKLIDIRSWINLVIWRTEQQPRTARGPRQLAFHGGIHALSLPVQEASLHVLYCQMHHSWLTAYLS